ncbi:MAG: ATP-binding protein [Mucilaginibacter sp.]
MPAESQTIINSFEFLRQVVRYRLQTYFKQPDAVFPAIKIEDDGTELTRFIVSQQFSLEEYILLLTALAPHFQPGLFENIIQEFIPQGGELIEFGGIRSGNYRVMLPTGETALFLLAGNDLEKRMNIQQLFSEDHFFYNQRILWLGEVKEGEPRMGGQVTLSQEWLDKMFYGQTYRPHFGSDFPAKLLETKMEWDDAVLNPNTRQQLDVIASWLQYNNELMQDANLSRKIKPGYRALFYGPPGTGKTLTASLIGKQFNKDVYRIDLSQIVSKYIGETEKNLEKVFNKADNHDWILFFDEADSLFGKRTNVQSSNDKYANQEVSYLLQRVEDFPGLIILASNLKNNIDPAFVRRFQQIIHFPSPDMNERYEIWKKMLPANIKLAEDTDLRSLAQKYEMSGAAIVNVMKYASLQALSKKDKIISQQDLIIGIHREFQKEDKTIAR